MSPNTDRINWEQAQTKLMAEDNTCILCVTGWRWDAGVNEYRNGYGLLRPTYRELI